MSKQHTNNKSYCGVCGVWVVGLSQHNTRSKVHERLYAPIRKRLAELRAQQRAAKAGVPINFPGGKVSASPISDDQQQ